MIEERATPRGLHFEDLDTGQVFRTNRVTVTEDAIIRFALEWDPQPFHIDKVAAATSHFGGIIASGLQTVLLTSRLAFDTGLFRGTAIAGVGFDEARFLQPVFPGDTLGVTVTVLDKQPSLKPGRGKLILQMETTNQSGEAVYRTILQLYVACRPHARSA